MQSTFTMLRTTMNSITSLTSTTPSLPLLIGLKTLPISDQFVVPTRNFTSTLQTDNLMLVDFQALRTSNGLLKLQRLVGMLKVSILQVRTDHTLMVLILPEITNSLLQLTTLVSSTFTDIHASTSSIRLEVMLVILNMLSELSSLQMLIESSPLVVMIRLLSSGDASEII